MTKEIAAEILNYARSHTFFSKKELLNALLSKREIKSSTLGWILYDLVRQNQLTRIKQGWYELGKKDYFAPEPTPRMIEIANHVRKGFPYTPFCLYTGEFLTGFQHHLFINNLVYLEVPRFMVLTMTDYLREMQFSAYPNPTERMMEYSINMKTNDVVVLPLVSQAPIQKIQDIPCPKLEKLLVDLYSLPVFNYLHGIEYTRILKNASEQYVIRVSTLLRYASRRHVMPEMKKYLYQAL